MVLINNLRRSKTNKIISGVCGGIAEYFNIDATIVRFIWLLFVFLPSKPGVSAYIICSIIIPEEDNDLSYSHFNPDKDNFKKSYLGIIFIVLGFILLAKQFLPSFSYVFIKILKFWPVIFILLGLYIIIKDNRR